MEEARSRLILYYQILALIQPEGAIKAVNLTALIKASNPLAPSMVERWAWKVIGLEAQIVDVRAALDALPEEYRRFLELRYRDECSLRATLREMCWQIAPSTAHTVEEKILGEFVKHLPTAA
jgi:DNA-directed RNA polymerase specialized sigma24 family protein